MTLDKQQILEFLRSRREDQKAEEASAQLPDQVDTDRDAGLLDKLGIDIGDMLGGGSGLGGKLGL